MVAAPEESVTQVSGEQAPREGMLSKFRRWRWALRRHRGLRYWLSVYGLFIFPPVAVLFVANGFAVGWDTAYSVGALNGSPWNTHVPWLAFILSLTGWLGIPALVGAVVGQIVVETTDNRRPTGPRIRWSGNSIPRLDRLLYDIGRGFNVRPEFPGEFLKVHDGNWKLARNHWVIMVGVFLDTVATDDSTVRMSPGEILILAVNEAAALLPAPVDRCPHCSQEKSNSTEGGAAE
jgi:hypothetical protein